MNAATGSGDELPILFQLRFSHFNEKARWALDHKRVPHRRRSLVPGRHSFRSKRLGGSGTTPLLQVDGEMVGDTTEIVARLETRNPDPPLYPDSEIDRKAALDLEDHFDEQLGPGIRSAIFHALLPHRSTLISLTMQGLPAAERALANALYPLLRMGVQRSLPADAEAARRGRAATVSALDLIESELEGDYLIGDRFSVADLTAASLLFPLVAPPQFPYWLPPEWPEEWEEFRRSLAGRSGYRWVGEIYARHRGGSAAVSED